MLRNLMLAALQIRSLELGHPFCGPWGCGPPTGAMISMHVFWLNLLLPPALYASRYFSFSWRSIGQWLLVAAILWLIGFGLYDYFGINRGIYEKGYVWQRYFLSVGSQVDMPMVQALLIGAVLIFFGKNKVAAKASEHANAENADAMVAVSE